MPDPDTLVLERHVEHFRYDEFGNRKLHLDANGKLAKFFYDHLNRLTREEHFLLGELSRFIDRTYDGANNLKTIDDGSTKIEFTYTTTADSPQPTNLLKQAAWSIGGAPFKTVSYVYDSCGRRTQMNEPDGGIVKYLYDGPSLLKDIQRQASGGSGFPTFVTFAYDAGGRRKTKTFGNGVVVTSGYDIKGRLTELMAVRPDGKVLSQFLYPEYDEVDNRKKMILVHANASWTYDYDCLSRLTSELCSGSNPGTSPVTNRFTSQGPGNALPLTDPSVVEKSTMPNAPSDLLQIAAYTAGYAYDDAGNRLTKTDTRPGQGTFTYSYDAENRLIQELADHPDPTPDETFNYRYDKNGNSTKKITVGGNTDTYSYDYANRIATFVRTNQAQQTMSNFSYSYAPSGERVMKTQVGGQTTAFMYDGPDAIADYTVPTQGSYSLVKTYLREMTIDAGICELATNGGVLGYFNTDALGSVHQLLDQPTMGAQPQVITGSTQLTTAWGEAILTGGGMTRYGFTQREREDESDLLYFRARHYSSRLGRFGQKDSRDRHLSHYVYAADAPLAYGDPTGLALYAFDGTGNDREQTVQQMSVFSDPTVSAPTHVAALYEMYQGTAFYKYGVGTRDGPFDNVAGVAGGYGAADRLDRMFADFEATYRN